MDYRNFAKDSLERAQKEISSKEDCRLHYAALELRRALEALIYQRATLCKDDLSSKKLNTWQPKPLLELLLEIDPYADKTTSIEIFRDKGDNNQGAGMIFGGTEQSISIKELKEYYGQLSSALHTPTINRKPSEQGPTPDKIRAWCIDIADKITQVLSSRVFNMHFKSTISINCRKCNDKIVKRMPPFSKPIVVQCEECVASYELTRISEQEVQWQPISVEVYCGDPKCKTKMNLWKGQPEIVGTFWKCAGCGGKNEIALGISFTPTEEDKNGK